MKLSPKLAFKLCTHFKKSCPYRGYASNLGNGLVITHTKRGEYFLIDFPITPEKVAKFEAENMALLTSLPQPDSTKLIALLKAKWDHIAGVE